MATRYENDWHQGPDRDGDGLSDAFEESVLHTDPTKRDTDGDGLNDLREKDFGSNPNLADTDGDGVNDGREVTVGTAPTLADTDGDGTDDRAEIRAGTAHAPDRDGDGQADWVQEAQTNDVDGDILKDGEEQWLGTDPGHANSDRDNLDDFEETILGGDLHRDPNAYDTPPGGIGDPPPDADAVPADVEAPTEVQAPAAEAEAPAEASFEPTVITFEEPEVIVAGEPSSSDFSSDFAEEPPADDGFVADDAGFEVDAP